MGYGKSNYSSGQKFQKTGKPGKGPGNNFIRVMCAMHSLAESGKWAVYYTTHWGYSGVSKSDPTKTTVRPFRCIEDKDFKTKFVRQACPECDNFRAKEAEAEAYKAELKKQGLDDKAIKADPKMKEFDIWLGQHAPERKWYINVMYKDRTFGDYKINHKTHKKGIDAKIQELQEQDIDATDLDQGVWFNIKRLGDGFTVPDVVEVEQKPGDKKGSFEILMAPLTEEEKARGLKECRDLAQLGGSVLTEEQIYALVQSDGSPEAVDKIFGEAPAQAPSREREEDEEPGDSAPAQKAAGPSITDEMKAKAAAILAKKAEEAAKAKAAADAKAKAEAAAQRAAAAVASAKAAEASASAPEAQPEVDPLKMNDEDFLAFFNSQQQST
jgi:hypothetical protein